MLQEAGSVEGTVTGDVWPIFSSSKHICSAQELHQLCFSLSLLFSHPSDALSLSLRPLTWCFSIQPTTFGVPLSVSLLLLAFFQLCLSSPSSFIPWPSHFPACSACVGVRLQLCVSQTTFKLFYSVWIKQHLPESYTAVRQLGSMNQMYIFL